MTMTLTQLNSFLTVCKHMSYTKAAQELFMSQSAVSHQIMSLENELGIKLFRRGHNSIEKTVAGEFLAQNLKNPLRNLDAILSQVSSLDSGNKGSLTVGILLDQCVDVVIRRVLHQLVNEQVRLSIRRLNYVDLDLALRNGQIDIALNQFDEVTDGCKSFTYLEEQIYLIMGRQIWERTGKSCLEICSSDLPLLGLSVPIIVPAQDNFPGNQYRLMDKEANRYGGWAVQYYDFDSILPMVESNLAATVANESYQLAGRYDIVFIPIRDGLKVRKNVFWLSEHTNKTIVRFLQLLGA